MTTYNPDVKPGDPVQFTGSTPLDIGKLAVDEKMSNNCYLLADGDTGERLLIDPADDIDAITAAYGREFSGIVVTHQHWDHPRALAAVVAGLHDVPVYAGRPDADAITEQTGIEVTHRVDQGDVIHLGNQELEVIAIAGHTPGSIALLHRDIDGEPHLFTGDSLFPGGVGATFGDAEAFAQLVDEVETKVFATLPDETVFHPGHGNDGLLGDERPHVREWRERGW
ncbi:MAG: MBL fold metallo-hydrolase [Nocardioides sp.]|nr:MBL fold metallo-hydrolase [Nocardioides sp.]